MFDETFTLDSPSGAALRVYRAHARRGRARGIVLVLHGLAEHAGRYGRLAGNLAEAGFHVFAHDHRGHGATTARDAPLGRFARREGARKVVADARAVEARARADHPGLPLALFGHSMGGLVAMNVARAEGARLAGVAAWNCSLNPGAAERVARLALAAERMLKGSDVPSAILARATFEAWGRAVAPRRTMFDWLSHDPSAVDAYVADPLCGFRPSVSMMDDVVTLVREGGSRRGLVQLPRALPIHLLGGRDDPATEGGRSVERLAERLADARFAAVETVLIEGARHETLNEAEPQRSRAVATLLGWLDRAMRG
jgi:alpha-beta hydrolase superfamily lysophospholipase